MNSKDPAMTSIRYQTDTFAMNRYLSNVDPTEFMVLGIIVRLCHRYRIFLHSLTINVYFFPGEILWVNPNKNKYRCNLLPEPYEKLLKHFVHKSCVIIIYHYHYRILLERKAIKSWLLNKMLLMLLYPSLQQRGKGGILVSPCPSVHPSVCPSVRPSTILISLGTYPNDQPMAYTSPKLYIMPRYITEPRISLTGSDYSSTNCARNISPKNGCWQPWRNVAGKPPGLWINTTMGWTIIWPMIVGALIHEVGTVIQAPKPVCQFMAEDILRPVLNQHPTTSIKSTSHKVPSQPSSQD